MQKNPVLYLATRLWQHAKGNRRNVVLYVGLFVCANVINLVNPLIVAKILNTIQEKGVSASTLPTFLFLIALLVLVPLLFWLFHGPARVLERANAFIVRANYKKHLLDGVMDLPIDWHVNHHSGDTIDKIEKGTNALYRFSADGFEIVGPLVALVGSYVALMYFNIHSGYILLALTALTVIVTMAFDKVIVRDYKKLNRAENIISEKVYDALSNITTVVILRIENLVSKSIFAKMMEPLPLYLRNNKINETKWFVVSMANASMVFFVLASYVYFAIGRGEAVLVGTIYALFGYVREINEVFFRFAYKYSDTIQQRASVGNAEEVSEAFRARLRTDASLLHPHWKRLDINNLSFSYHGEGREVHLDGISLSIERGKRVAVIGASGSGKTTFLKIMRELYTPHTLELLLDGEKLPRGFADISHDISLIPQEPEIFATTIRDNITVGVPYDEEVIARFVDMACFTEVAKRLPHGLDSSIVEKGVNLSGGEKQRLALSRGLLASEEKTIVLLDEPTSSVDSKNELQIYKNVFGAFKDKTIISSIHRLHLLPLFDVIYLFSDGKIIASGSFETLLQTSVEFQDLYAKYNHAREFVEGKQDKGK